MMRRSAPLSCSLFLSVFPLVAAHAQGTRLWTQSTFQELEQGKPDGVSITSDGRLMAGPGHHLLYSSPATDVWSIDADKTGNAYLATGQPAAVERIAPDGKATTLFTTKDLAVQTVRVGPDGAIYAATLPSGKVYKLPSDAKGLNQGNATVVFDPADASERPKFLWDMAFDTQGRLYIAAGGPAGIYRVAPGQKPELFFKSDEQHIRALAFDTQGNLIAGSDGSGLVYRIDKNGKGYVIYDASRREITALTLGSNGAIYVAAVGEKGRNTLPPLPAQGIATVMATITVAQPGSVQAFNGNTLIPDGTDIFELAPNGSPRKLWSDKNDIVYALHWTPQGLLVASGNRGRIFRIDENGEYADVAHLESSQATGFADSPNALYVATANSGKLYTLTHGDAPTGTYTSDVFDAGLFAKWGRAEVEDTGKPYDLYARAGNVENPERAWSDWKKVTPNTGSLGLEAARFVQWKAELHAGANLSSVGLNYLPVNVAPVIEEMVVEPGARVSASAAQPTVPQPVTINFPAHTAPVTVSSEPGRESLAGTKDRTAATVRWLAHDENGDELRFSVYYRGEGEQNWQLLKENITDRYLTFDASLLPDGPYRLKVVATDAPSHNLGEAMTGEKVSSRFLIDTTPPVISALTTKLASGKIHVTFTATDSATPISRAEYSVDAGPWQYVEPVGAISDARTESFEFDAPPNPANTEGSEHVLTVRVFDRNDNSVAAKSVVSKSGIH